MDKKILTVDPEKCTGCRNCELVCSVMHNGVSNPSLARIQIVKWENIGVYIPMSCQHCEDAPCMAVCPKDAITAMKRWKASALTMTSASAAKCVSRPVPSVRRGGIRSAAVFSNAICVMEIRNACASATPRRSTTWKPAD